MTHLYINQSTGLTEEVNSAIISKLYNTVINNELDNRSDLIGRLHSYRGYAQEVQYLTTNFQNLFINCDELYVQFQDPLVESILATNFGDGTGITNTTVALTTSLLTNNGYSAPFQRQAITTFNELPLFVNLKTIGRYCFDNCTSLTSVDLSNIETIVSQSFYNCSALADVGNTANLKSIGAYAFKLCSSLTSINLSNVEYIEIGALEATNLTSADFSSLKELNTISCTKIEGRLSFPSLETFSSGGAFSNWKRITHIDSLGTINSIPNGEQFPWTDSLVGITLPATLTTMGENNFKNMRGNLRYIRVLATTPPTLPTTGNDISSMTNVKVYVPDASVNTYKAASGWSMFSGKIFSLTQFATDFPNE